MSVVWFVPVSDERSGIWYARADPLVVWTRVCSAPLTGFLEAPLPWLHMSGAEEPSLLFADKVPVYGAGCGPADFSVPPLLFLFTFS